MQVLFIVEGGFKAGLGHLLRSRVLLLELRARGHSVDLWLHGDKTALEGRDWPVEMQLFHSPESESANVACDGISRLLGRSRYDWLVIDGYAFSGRALCVGLAAKGAKLLILDDVADRELKADILLNQNTAHAEIYAHDQVDVARFLLGPEYALIDRSYASGRTLARSHGELRRVLVTFGGVDRHGRTQRVLDLILAHAAPVDIVAVVGPYYPYLNELESWSGRRALQVVQNAHDLSRLMQQCDLMVTAGGSTVWQACCSGVPMLVLQTVGNQELVIKTLREFGAALCLDASINPKDGAGIAEHEFTEAFQQAADVSVRAGLASSAMRLVDGSGAVRVTKVLESWG